MATLTYIFKVSLYDMFVATTFTSFLSEFGTNLSYNGCDTVIFVNSYLDLYFQGQMISRFVAGCVAIIVVKKCITIGAIIAEIQAKLQNVSLTMILIYGVKFFPAILFNSQLFSENIWWQKEENRWQCAGDIFDVLTFFMQPNFKLEKKN